MCNFWSCILTRDGRVLWSTENNSHEALVKANGLKDGKLVDRDFVRIEITPPENDVLNQKRSEWHYKVDEEGTLPEWYANDTRGMEKLVWTEWRKMVDALNENVRASINLDRKAAIMEQVVQIRPGDKVVSRSTVKAALNEHVKLLMAQDQQHREFGIKEVRFYTLTEWDSVRDSVWASVRDSVWASVRDSVRDSVWASVRDSVWASVRDSVWDSVWDSVRASVWASVRASVWASVWASFKFEDSQNFGLPLIDCLENGCVLYGIDKDGVAHVIMFGKDEGA